jgi:GT2 family glycosyltransferase
MMSSCETDAMTPLVSIVVITRNRSVSLKRALQTLAKLDYPSYEIIVVDNASTDDTAQIAAAFSVRYLYSPSNYGISRCRKEGVDAARGEIIAFCDDDCVPSSQWLRHLARRLWHEKDLGLVGGQVINIGFTGGQRYKGRTKLGRNGTLSFAAKPEEAEFFGNMNLAFRKEVIQAIGGYDPFFNVMEEIDLATRMRRSGFRVDYEPAAILEHHNTGAFFKKRHLFFGPQLIRLYLYFKHFRPQTLPDWLSFLGYELKLMWRDLIRFIRALAAATFKGKLQRYPAIAIALFNLVSARLAIPWLLWKTRFQASMVK